MLHVTKLLQKALIMISTGLICEVATPFVSAVNAAVPVTAAVAPKEGLYASSTPRYIFANMLAEQETQLKTNPLMLRFARSRQEQAADPHWPSYHFVSPESTLNDPNGLTFWQGRWHLFYQGYPPDEFPYPKDRDKRRQQSKAMPWS